jgi:hypothetical protein
MSTWQPPWSAQEQVKLTLLPPTQANNSPASRRPPGPGSTAALRGLAWAPAPRDLPADLGWSGGASPARPPTTRRPGGAEPFVPRPASPAPTVSTSTTEEEDPAGGNRPDATTASPTGGLWRGREEFALLGWGNNPSMVVLRRNGRRRAAGAEPMVRAFGETRTCAEDGCTARLSRYNPARCCAIHQGWDGQVVTRPRRRRP